MLAVAFTSYWMIATLIAVALALFVAEVFIPSGGLIAVAGAVCLISGIVSAFANGVLAGVIALAAAVVLAPVAVMLGVRLLPRSPLTRGIVLADDDETRLRAATRLSPSVVADRGRLVGARGTVLRDLRPSGLIELAGERVEVVSEGEFIDAGTVVEVVKISGRDIVVRSAEPA